MGMLKTLKHLVGRFLGGSVPPPQSANSFSQDERLALGVKMKELDAAARALYDAWQKAEVEFQRIGQGSGDRHNREMCYKKAQSLKVEYETKLGLLRDVWDQLGLRAHDAAVAETLQVLGASGSSMRDVYVAVKVQEDKLEDAGRERNIMKEQRYNQELRHAPPGEIDDEEKLPGKESRPQTGRILE